jgi:antitoxin (DNA-binding transcriptional repressor) of toxin-antitoxin stability system
MYHMKDVTVRDLRYDFPKVERLLRKGQALRVTKRGKVIARLEPEGESIHSRPQLPDFLARMQANFGDRVLEPSGAELISAERDERP